MSVARCGLRGGRLAALCSVALWGADAAGDEPPPIPEPPAPPAAEPAPAHAPSTPVDPPEAPASPPAVAPPPPLAVPPAPVAVPSTRKRDERLGLFESLGTNILDSLSGCNLVFYGVAIGSTAALSASGADDAVQRWFWRGNAILAGTGTDIAFVGGWFTPLVIPTAIALTGIAVDDSEAASAGVTALQAVGITGAVTQLAKFITGRPLPYEDGIPSDEDAPVSLKRSDDGRKWGDYGKWGPIGGGIAWPSGHTSAHMALASSLVAFYRQEKWLPFVAYPLVATVALAMVEGDHHWFSDVVAGGLVGHAIGWTVGSNMRRKYDAAHGKPAEDPSSVQVQPVVSRDTLMLVLSL